MAVTDRSEYVTLLLEGAEKGLRAHGQKEQTNKLAALFTTSGDKGGAHQFMINLQAARVLNEQLRSDPNNKQPLYQVENALAVTLKQNGIVVPVTFLLGINKDFKPSSPPAKN